MSRKEFKGVTEYINAAPEWAKATLRKLRSTIKAAAPEAKESISYRIPYYSQDGRLAYFGAHKNHCSFYWLKKEDMKLFAKELSKCKIVGNTLQIPKGEPVPVSLIKKIVKARLKSNKAKK